MADGVVVKFEEGLLVLTSTREPTVREASGERITPGSTAPEGW